MFSDRKGIDWLYLTIPMKANTLMQGGKYIKEILIAQRVIYGINMFLRGVQCLDMRYANRPNIIMKP